MPTQYETNFVVENTADAAGAELLQSVIQAIEQELRSADGAAGYELEANCAGSVGYAHFSGERSHPSLPAAVRLEARLCTLDEEPGVAVQILTRFISADGTDLPERAAGPPRLLDAIVERFQCRAGVTEIGTYPVELMANYAEAFAREHVFNPQRTMPILLITQNSIDPAQALRMLKGVAEVVHCVDNADQSLMHHTNIRTYGGAARIYWPGCEPGKNGRPPPGFRDFYMPNDARGLSLYEVQKACLANELGTNFDTQFSSARTTVILERNRQLEAESRERDARPEPGDRAKIAELENARRIAEVRGNEMNRRLQAAQLNIEQLTREKEEAQEIIGGLEEEITELTRHSGGGAGDGREERNRLRSHYEELRARTMEQEKTIARLNDDNQQLRQRERVRDGVDGRTLRLGTGRVGNITTLNHALNICRGPCREFIVRKLQAGYGNDLTDALGKAIEFRDNQRSAAADCPEAAFDIGDFSAIISSNPNCFENWLSLSRKMDEVRHIRNRAAHPPPDGFDKDRTLDSLRMISDALEDLDGKQSREAVVEIRELIETMRTV